MEAATRQYSVGEVSMIAQAGDNHALADGLRTSPSLTDSQRPGYSDIGETETPNVKPDALDSKASPLKPTPGECPTWCMASVADTMVSMLI